MLGLKLKLSAQRTCQGCPEEFAQALRYCRKLGFKEPPNYRMLISLFEDLASKKNIKLDDNLYDWSVKAVIMRDYPKFYDFLDPKIL